MWKSLALFIFVQVCAHGPLHPRVAGGTDANKKDYPWMVSLHNPTCHFCGGSLITKEWVLSAAHCFMRNQNIVDKGSIRVYLGKMTQRENNKKEVMKNVQQIYIHNLYNANTKDNDIALLQLDSPVTTNDYISPVCLVAHGSDFPTDTRSTIIGWGKDAFGDYIPYPGTLQEAEVLVKDNNQCQTQLNPILSSLGMTHLQITNNMICAGISVGGAGPNCGDSGGPIMSQPCSWWVQFGITSWGIGCGRPGVYTRISQYQQWITNTIQNHPGQDLPQFVDVNVQCPTGSGTQDKKWKWCCCK